MRVKTLSHKLSLPQRRFTRSQRTLRGLGDFSPVDNPNVDQGDVTCKSRKRDQLWSYVLVMFILCSCYVLILLHW